MRPVLRLILVIVLLIAARTAGVAQTPPPLSCHGTQRPRQVAELIFGRDIGKRVGVSESDFARFVAREITPRFPDGLTITDAVGQWRDPDSGHIVREPSKAVEIVLAGNGGDQARLDAVVNAYKRDFRQHSVAVIVRGACVSF
jgi:hypothetical protein